MTIDLYQKLSALAADTLKLLAGTREPARRASLGRILARQAALHLESTSDPAAAAIREFMAAFEASLSEHSVGEGCQ